MKKVFLMMTALCMVLVMGCSADHSDEDAVQTETGAAGPEASTIGAESAKNNASAVGDTANAEKSAINTAEEMDEAEKTLVVADAEALDEADPEKGDGAKTVEEREAEIIAQEAERQAYLDEYVGTYTDDTNDFSIYKGDDGNYYMTISITRLTTFEDCDVEPCNSGVKVTSTQGDGNGNLITFEFSKKGSSYTLLVTDSSWGYLPAGEKFKGIKKVDSSKYEEK